MGGYAKFKPTEGNSLPVWMKNAGYITAFVGKYVNGYGDDDPTHIPPGWDFWRGLVDSLGTYQYYEYTINEDGNLRSYGKDFSDYQTDVLAQEAANFVLSQKTSSQPFFMWVTPVAPHIAKKSFYGDNPEPANRHNDKFANLPLPQPPNFNELDMSDKPAFMQQHPLLDSNGIAGATKLYRDRRETLLAVDDMVEKIVNALQEAGKLDDTIIIYTSDNGYFHGEHRRNNNKYLVYEESIRVPLIIRGPDIPKNETRSQMVNNADVIATIVEIAKATPGRILDGHSLLPLFNNPAEPWRTALLVQGADQSGLNPKSFSGRYQAVRTPSYLYVEHTTGEQELYDLIKDPYQLTSQHNNPEYTSVKEKLKQILDSLRICSGASCWYTTDISALTTSQTNFSCSSAATSFELQNSPAQTQCPSIKENTKENTTSPANSLLSFGVSQTEKQTSTSSTSSPLLVANLFRTTLYYGQANSEVKRLQSFLAKDKTIYPEGLVTGYFGLLTQQAVIRFQEKYAADILAPQGLTKGTGIVGPLTLKKLNELILEEKMLDQFDY